MKLTTQIAKQVSEFYFGGNWASANLKEHLADLTWQQATTRIYSFNTIAALVYHMNYYVSAVLKEFQGESIDAKDKFSFDLPAVLSRDDWEKLLKNTWSNAEKLASLVEQLPEEKLLEDFTNKKHGNYYRNIHGIMEHNHYHLGQIVVIKKILFLTSQELAGNKIRE